MLANAVEVRIEVRSADDRAHRSGEHIIEMLEREIEIVRVIKKRAHEIVADAEAVGCDQQRSVDPLARPLDVAKHDERLRAGAECRAIARILRNRSFRGLE